MSALDWEIQSPVSICGNRNRTGIKGRRERATGVAALKPCARMDGAGMRGSLPGEERDGKQGGNQQRGNDVPET